MFHNKYEINEFDVKIFKQSPCYNCANASIESEYGEKKETNCRVSFGKTCSVSKQVPQKDNENQPREH